MHGLRSIWNLVFGGLFGLCCLATSAIAQDCFVATHGSTQRTGHTAQAAAQKHVDAFNAGSTDFCDANNKYHTYFLHSVGTNTFTVRRESAGTPCSNKLIFYTYGTITQVCEPPCLAKAGLFTNNLFSGEGRTFSRYVKLNAGASKPANYYTCHSGCLAKAQAVPNDFSMGIPTEDGKVQWTLQYEKERYTGDSCAMPDSGFGGPQTSGESPTTPNVTGTVPKPTHTHGDLMPPPPSGKCPGFINDVLVYVNCDKRDTPTTTQSVTAGTVTTQTSTQTTCDGNVCTKTTTITSNSGGTTQTTSSTEGASGGSGTGAFCKLNPSAQACTGGGDGDSDSSFGGSCAAGFTCSGDAAQCAAARGVWESRCALKALEGDTGNAAFTAGAAATAAGGADPANHPRLNKTTQNIVLDQTNPYNAQCPADISISLSGFTAVIPLASKCSTLQLMGNLLVAFTLLLAAVIIVRGA